MIRKFFLLLGIYFFSQFSFAQMVEDTGQGKTLVLIHAFPTDHRLWAPQEAGLKSKFRVITLDLLGFGQAPETTGVTVNMSMYAAQVKQILDKLEIKKAIIGGESMGGYVALAFLEKYPNQVEGLILSNTESLPPDDATKAKLEKMADQVLSQGTAPVIQDVMAKALSPSASKQTKQFLLSIIENQRATGMASALRGMANRSDTSHVLTIATIPVLIITGENDAVLSPEFSKKMHLLARDSKLVIIPKAGHLSNLDQPNQWNDAVIKMFGQ